MRRVLAPRAGPAAVGVMRLHAARSLARRAAQDDPRGDKPRTYNDAFARLLRDNMMREAPEYAREQMEKQRDQIAASASARTHAADDGKPVVWRQMRGRQSRAIEDAKNSPRLMLILVVVGASGVYYVFNLEKVPETGRWRFLDVGIAQEREMGEQAFQQTMQEYHGRVLPDWHPEVKRVQRVVARILRVIPDVVPKKDMNELPDHWSVHVINDPEQKNAFVLPGGHIFVFTGILPVCETDSGLATVLSHEISHQLARHSAEKVSGYKIFMALGFLLNVLGFDFGLSQIALNLLLSLPNSRKLETEGASRACAY